MAEPSYGPNSITYIQDNPDEPLPGNDHLIKQAHSAWAAFTNVEPDTFQCTEVSTKTQWDEGTGSVFLAKVVTVELL